MEESEPSSGKEMSGMPVREGASLMGRTVTHTLALSNRGGDPVSLTV